MPTFVICSISPYVLPPHTLQPIRPSVWTEQEVLGKPSLFNCVCAFVLHVGVDDA